MLKRVNIFFFIASMVLLAGRVQAGVSSGNINSITPTCVGSTLTFAAETDSEDAVDVNPGHDYGTVLSAPNPAWFYFAVDTGGRLDLQQSNSNYVDVDGVLWGPFDSLSDLTRDGVSSSYDSSLLIDSDWTGSPFFSFSTTVEAGKYYVLLVANYSEAPTNISLDSGFRTVATTDCAVTYGIDLQVDDTTLATTEGGATASYEVSLYRRPAADVIVNLTTTINEVTLSAPSLTFTTTNWDTTQDVTLTAVDDSVLDGHLTDTILHTVSSTDSNYNGRTAEVAVVANDNDLIAPTVNTLLTNNTTPTLSGSHDSSAVLSVALDAVTYSEGDGDLIDNADDTWTLVIPIAMSEGAYNVAATSAFGAYTQSDSTSDELIIDGTNPVPTVSISSITSDNAINAAEASGSVVVSGVVGGDFATNDTVTLSVDGNDFTDTVNGAGEYSVSIPGTLLAANTLVSASVDTTEASGNTGTAVASRNYTVDTIDPIPDINLNNVTTDNIVNASDAGGNINVSGVVSGDFTAGDAIQLVVGAGSYAGNAGADGSFSISVPGTVVESATSTSASISTSDAAGNAGTASDSLSYTVDTTPPVASISVDDITADNVVNSSESSSTVIVSGAVGGEFVAGNIVTLTVNGATYTGSVSGGGFYSINVAGAQLAADTAVAASFAATDAAGNSAAANTVKSYSTDLLAPALTIALDNVTTDNVVNSAESAATITLTGAVGGDFIVGDTVTVVVNGSTYNDTVDGSGDFSVDVPGSGVAADTSVAISVTSFDAAGNSSTQAGTHTYAVDTMPPVATISLASVTNDDVINSSEAAGSVIVSGVVSGDFTTGDTVTVTVNGSSFTDSVDAGGAYSVIIAGSLLSADTVVSASVVVTESSGNIATAAVSRSYTVDTVVPVPEIDLDNVTTDNVLNAAEAGGAISMTGIVSGDYNTGDAVQLTIGSSSYPGSVLVDGRFSISVPGSVLELANSISALVNTSDAANNTGSATDALSYTVDTTLPVASIVVGDITADNVINIDESGNNVNVSGAVGGEFSAGDVVTLIVNGANFTGSVSGGGLFSIDVTGAQLAADTTVDASIAATDAAGNSAVANTVKSYSTDLLAPALTIALDNITTDNVVNSAESASVIALTGVVGGEFNAGDIVTVLVNGSTITDMVDGSGAFSVDVPGSDVAADTSVAFSVVTTDGAGNSATQANTHDHVVDTTVPVATLTVNAITNDDVINGIEAGGFVLVSGLVSGEFTAGDTVTLTVDGVDFITTVDSAGAYSVGIPGALLAENSVVDASIAASNASGNTGTGDISHGYAIDTVDPVPIIVLDSVTTDNVVNAAEAISVISITGIVTGDFTTGDVVQLLIGANSYSGTAGIDGSFSISVPGADLEAATAVSASVSTVDAAGNTGSATDVLSYVVDTLLPVASIGVEDITADNVINISESSSTITVSGTVGGEYLSGDIVTLVVNGVSVNGSVSGTGTFDINLAGAQLAADTAVNARVVATDAAGNSAVASSVKSYTVDVTAPAPTVALNNLTSDNVINSVESAGTITLTGLVGGDFEVGDTVTADINGSSHTVTVDGAGVFSIDVAASDLIADTRVAMSVTTTDDAGNFATRTNTHDYAVDTTAPVATLIVNAISNDDVINAAEADDLVVISGVVSGEFTAGDTVTVTVDSMDFNSTVDNAGAYSVSIAGALLATHSVVSASVEATDESGNAGTGSVLRPYGVDTQIPLPVIEMDNVTTDNVINFEETGDQINITGVVSGEFTAGDVIELEIAANAYSGSAASDGSFSISVPGAELELANSISASVSTIDASGNTGSASDVIGYMVDTVLPIATIVVNDITEDNIVNSDETLGVITVSGTVDGQFLAGDIIMLDVNDQAYTGSISAAGTFAINLAGAQLAADTSIDSSAIVTDAAGNSAFANATKLYGVDLSAPVTSVTLNNVTSDNVVNSAEAAGIITLTGAMGGEYEVGDTVTLEINGRPFSDTVDGAGRFSVDVPGDDVSADASIAISVTTTDNAGNSTTQANNHHYSVDTALPVVALSVDSITDDDVINAAELESIVQITGRVAGEVNDGAVVLVRVNGNRSTGVDATEAAGAIEVAGTANGDVLLADELAADVIENIYSVEIGADGVFSVDVPGEDLTGGTSLVISVSTTDAAGNSASISVEHVYSVDIEPPNLDVQINAVAIDNIINATEARNTVVVSGAVSGDFVSGDAIKVTANSQEFEGTVDEAGAFSIDVPGSDLIEDTSLTVSISSTDVAGNTATQTEAKVYSVDTTMPELSAASQSYVGSSTPELGGTTNADVGAEVNILDSSNTTVCTAVVVDGTLENTWSCTPESPLPDGNITLTASTVDEAGNAATVAVPIVVDATIPFLEVVDQTLVHSAKPTFSGITNEPAYSIVSITSASGDSICNATVTSDGSWSCLPTMLLDEKTHDFIASITDDTGNTAIAEFSVTVDLDYDNDGIPSLLEGTSDLDLDGIPNFQDTDSDGDGISDLDEGAQDADGDQAPNYLDLDADGDGLPDELEAGSAGSTVLDSDADGTPDYLDNDSDNDGTDDTSEGALDTDGDGLANWIDPDSDNDGISDVEEGTIDTDGDGIADSLDLDSDDDGIPDWQELSGDSDSDGIPNYRDLDSDNDGLSDVQEAGGLDTDADGVLDIFADTDSDGVSDFIDVDSDNDGLSDLVEAAGLESDADGDGRVDAFVDANGDGQDDGINAFPLTREDTDNDGLPDHLDLDTDNDGVFDLVEAGGQDRDGDGINDVQGDVDDDGIPNSVDVDQTMGSDADADGIDDLADVDFVSGADTDGDGIVDSSDPDPDGDGIADVLLDVRDGNSQVSELPDIDRDGIPDLEEANSVGLIRTGVQGSGCSVSSSSGTQSPFLMFMATIAMLILLIRRRAAVVTVLVSAIALGGTLDSVTNVSMADGVAGSFGHDETLSEAFREDKQYKDRIKRTIYTGVGFGVSQLNPDTSPLDGTDVIDGNQVSGQLTLGADLNRWLSLELHGAELGSAYLSSGGGINYREFGASVLFYAGKSRYHFKRTGLSAFGRIGYGVLFNDRDGDPVGFIQENNTHILYGAGIEYVGRRGLGFRAEGIYFDADVRYSQLGLIYRFGKTLTRAPFLTLKQNHKDIPEVQAANPVSSQKSEVSSATHTVETGSELPNLADPIEGVDSKSGTYVSGSYVLVPVSKRHPDDLEQSCKFIRRYVFKCTGSVTIGEMLNTTWCNHKKAGGLYSPR